MARETAQAAALRWKKLKVLQEHYVDFTDFLNDVITDFLGFTCTDIQEDIGDFLANGPQYSMIQAQRGQAKTTITAIYAVWRMIHDPTTRTLIVSAGGPLAKEIANWIIQIIMGMSQLECLRPDPSNGDRQSVEAFDVHYSLKGPEKSPSVACLGVTSNIQGRRADLLIADDIESSKNSESEIQREKLRKLTRDFTSICSKGKIVYLGTPQSIDSVYNSLPSRGYTVRVWTGRYPTEKEEQNYGNALAPLLQERMRENPDLRTGGGPTGERGKPTDPVLLDEETLTKKEIDQGSAYFQLQHMLDTRLMDADRYPLKVGKLVFMTIPQQRIPLFVDWLPSPEYQIHTSQDYPIDLDLYEIHGHGDDFAEFQGTHMYIDPSGGGKNGDEMAWAVTKFRSGYVYLVDIGGIPGGLHEENQNYIANLAEKWKPDQIDFEDNFGAGAFRQVITPVILKKHRCAIEGVYETGQKELRIIDTLEPLIGGQRLIVEKDLIELDWKRCGKYGLEIRSLYSLFFQMARLTRDKGSLGHDDRLDALAGSCRHWTDMLAVDKEKEHAKAKQEAWRQMRMDPLGDGSNRLQHIYGGPKHNTIFDKFRRK